MEKLLETDRNLFLALNFDGGPVLDEFFWHVSGKLTWIPLYLLIILLVYRRYGWRYTLAVVVFIAAAIGFTDQVCNLFKNNLPKFRPTHDPSTREMIALVKGYLGKPYGTVSAHTATTSAIAVISAAVIRRSWFNWMVLVWVLLVAYSRIYIGAHFPLDILFGALLGILTGVLCAKALLLIREKWVTGYSPGKD